MTDVDGLLDRVHALIAAGQHRDGLPGLPGVALTGGGVFSGGRRLYYRGTEAFAVAAAEGLLDRLPAPPPPAGPTDIEEVESLVGARLPRLLKHLYTVANGGFGPGWDPNPVEPDDDIPFFEQEYLIDDWIEAWLDGALQQPWLLFDPETRTYRGASVEETRAAMAENPD